MMDTATRPVKLTAKERRALAELSKPVGKRDYSRVHGHTIHALQRKGLFGSNGKPGGALTSAGHAELAVPDIFDDLFNQRDTAMPKTESNDAFRTIEHIETTLHDTVRDRWDEGSDEGGVRLYRTASPLTHGQDNARWALQVRARVKTKAGPGKHFAVGTASMSRADLQWLRGQINAELRRKS